MRTWDGTTEVFSVLTSVRQGDPFAPIMLAMINDVLHRGYVDGHAGSLSGVGYTFDAGPATRIASCGYADDVLVFAESVEALQRMHQWTREFFGAHAFKLNAKKTKLTGYCAPGELDGKFFTVDGITAIEPIPPSTDFRYLGVHRTGPELGGRAAETRSGGEPRWRDHQDPRDDLYFWGWGC